MIQNGATFEVQEVSPLQIAEAPSSESVTVRSTLSSFQSLKIGSAGFLRLIYGVTSSSETVVALSSAAHSPAVLPSKWCVPVAIHAMDPSPSSFLTSVAANILAKTVLSSVPDNGVLLVRKADEAFRTYLQHGAKELNVKTVFVTSQDNTYTADSFYIHPRLSQHKLKQLLPADVSVYADLSQGAKADALSQLIDKCLPSQCVHIKRSSLLSNDITDPHPRFCDMISQLLQQAIETSTHPAEFITIPLTKVSEHSVFEPLTVVDWSIESVPVIVRPIDSGIIFRPDRTYFFVGLAGELGQSLCQWMASHGAKYFVMSSRSPKVNPNFIEAMAQQGATVRTMLLSVKFPSPFILSTNKRQGFYKPKVPLGLLPRDQPHHARRRGRHQRCHDPSRQRFRKHGPRAVPQSDQTKGRRHETLG
jgi:hybrid polyketide synthase/nonribosomal peptide synthetase ACE1